MSMEDPQVSDVDAMSGTDGEPERPLRKDAERNRQRILAAAAEVFTERGLEATLDDVARHAGVGVGTVYRRFPDKAALADALFEERIDALVELATAMRNNPLSGARPPSVRPSDPGSTE